MDTVGTLARARDDASCMNAHQRLQPAQMRIAPARMNGIDAVLTSSIGSTARRTRIMDNAARRRRRIAEAISCVSGCRLTGTIDGVTGGHPPKALKVTGRGPSLHRIDMIWWLDDCAADDWSSVLGRVEARMAIQRGRLKSARRLGVGHGNHVASASEIGHIAVDRVLHECLTGQETASDQSSGTAFDLYRSAVSRIVGSNGSDGGMQAQVDGRLFEDHGEHALCLPYAVEGLAFDGQWLSIPADLPEIIIAALPGQRIASIVDLPKALVRLADRTVRHVRRGAGRVELVMDADWVRISDLAMPRPPNSGPPRGA